MLFDVLFLRQLPARYVNDSSWTLLLTQVFPFGFKLTLGDFFHDESFYFFIIFRVILD